MIIRVAAISYELQILEGFVVKHGAIIEVLIDIKDFKNQPEKYTIIGIRNKSEINENKKIVKAFHSRWEN